MRRHPAPPLVVLAVVLAFATACKEEAAPPPPVPAEPGATGEVESKIDAKPAADLPPPKLDGRGLPDRDSLYSAISRFTATKNRRPKNLEELIANGYLPPLPAPPAGKKYVLDVFSAAIELADAPQK